jgi:signal transduction histidine kinase
MARREAEATAARIARLQAATSALSSARTPDEVAAVALEAGLVALGGARGFVLALGASGALEVLRSAGLPDGMPSRAAASCHPNPATEAFRTAVPVFVSDRGELVRLYPALAAMAERMTGEALAALPLAAAGRSIGVLAVGFDGPRKFPDTDRALAAALAGQCAQALERARLFSAERRARAEAVAARKRLAFLDELSALLASTVDESEMLEGVAKLAVPALGEWAGIFTRSDGGPPVLACDAGPEALGRAVEAHLRDGAQRRLSDVGCSAEPFVVDDFPGDPTGERTVPAAAVAPLCVRGHALGAIAIATADPVRTFAPGDVALLGDVAHRTALAVEHARLLRDATLAARAREEFLQVASHELRGPVGTLRLSVQMLMRGASPAAQVARLRAIERQAQRLGALSDTLLDVSRITAGRLELTREHGDLAALVREAAVRASDAASEAGSELSVDAPEPLPLSCDPARLDQVVSNLLSNAVKYGRGRPIRVSVRQVDGRGRIEVEDRGIGIAPDDLGRVFERFERAVSVRHYGGLGLGLWIVRRLVEAHGGTIHVRSTLGEGSTFTIDLPLASPGGP